MCENESIKNLYNYSMENFIETKLYFVLSKFAIDNFKKSILSDELQKKIYSLAEEEFRILEDGNKTFREVLPDGFENSLKVLTYNKAPDIAETIKDYLKQESFKVKVKNEINKFISGLNPMVAKFVNTENIYNKIMASIFNHMDNQENTMNMVMLINDKIDVLADKSVNEITAYIPYEGKKNIIKAFVDSIQGNIVKAIDGEEFSESFKASLLSYHTLGEFLDKLGLEEKDFLKIIL